VTGLVEHVVFASSGQKYTEAEVIALLRVPNDKMSGGGMTPVDLKQEELEALVAYIRQLH
jgi:cytochrome c2